MAFAWRSKGLLRSAPLWRTLGSDFPLGVSGAWAALAGALASVPQLTNLAHCRHSSASTTPEPRFIRDFAIIAHVDHGKTTLMDRLLAHCGVALAGEERYMDSNALEKERGITISAKYTSIRYKGHVVNAVDTPGHADFGGEVERILGMVDGAVLLVDANEGPLSQTKFVVEKALRHGLHPLVVLNKVDRPSATEERCGQVASQLFDLFAQLGASEEQLDFPVLYASARQGWASRELPSPGSTPDTGMAPLLDAILEHVPPPAGNPAAPLALLVAMVERDAFLGPIATGRIADGTARPGDRVRVMHHAGGVGAEVRLTKIWKRVGTGRQDMEVAGAGDIVSLTGAGAAAIADTIAGLDRVEPLAPGPIEPPTLSMVFSPNDSPLAGREGTHLTGSKIGVRLVAEAASSVSLRVLPAGAGGEAFEVQARGELQLGLLIENMRREGFELSVSPPEVVYRRDGGQRLEPIEEIVCEVEDQHAGAVIEGLTVRKGELLEMLPTEVEGKQRLVFEAPSRGLIGFRSAFATLTRGTGLMHRAFVRYGPFRGPLDRVRKGALVSTAEGRTTVHALGSLEARGSLFAEPQTEVYMGMLVGESARDGDMDVNPVREKKLTNVRSAGNDEKVFLAPPRVFTLEDAIGYVNGDELIEVTPGSIRLRKRVLDPMSRIPRVPGGGTHRAGQGAFGNMCRGGRMFAPTKTWRRWHRKININLKRYAVASALAASAVPALVMARGHRIDAVPELPLVVEVGAENLTKTSKAVELLKKLGCEADIDRAKASRNLRRGKGKMRNRRYVTRKGPLVVYSESGGIDKAFRNLPGVEVQCVERLNLLQLAPGGHLGRFIVWTKSAFERLNEIFGTTEEASKQKSGYKLPRAPMTNADLTRLINSDEIQSVVRPARSGRTARPLKKNALKNLGALLKLNPYAKTARRVELLAEERRRKAKAEKMAAIREGRSGGGRKRAEGEKEVGKAFIKQLRTDSEYQGEDYEVFSSWLGQTA
ncbi:hypothetical protein WJX81_001716 [Elliptochloris bilobata]|uniref:Tr-type G domain-containing protein n=1 Tax=Elliptochloris bilobata TaxID=381761 RepID=A0AAW1R0A0_9CHLO